MTSPEVRSSLLMSSNLNPENPTVVSSTVQYVVTMLSPVYIDTSKDCLYADAKDSPERRAMIAVMAQVLDTMTSIVAPILPYFAEEIHETLHQGDCPSVFLKKWAPLVRAQVLERSMARNRLPFGRVSNGWIQRRSGRWDTSCASARKYCLLSKMHARTSMALHTTIFRFELMRSIQASTAVTRSGRLHFAPK